MHPYLTDLDFTAPEAGFLLAMFAGVYPPTEPKARKQILDLIRACHDTERGMFPASLPSGLGRLYNKVSNLSTANATGVLGYCLGWWAAHRGEPAMAEAPAQAGARQRRSTAP